MKSYEIRSVGPCDDNSTWSQSVGPHGHARIESEHETLADAVCAFVAGGWDCCRYANGVIHDRLAGRDLTIKEAREKLGF